MEDTIHHALQFGIESGQIVLKSPEVKWEGLADALGNFLVCAAECHRVLFDKPLVITCGVDGIEHKTGKHPKGEAVDVRVSDLTPLQQERFLSVVCELCDHNGLTVFDERNLPGASHFHVEVAG